jgi:hypothetical protein
MLLTQFLWRRAWENALVANWARLEALADKQA